MANAGGLWSTCLYCEATKPVRQFSPLGRPGASVSRRSPKCADCRLTSAHKKTDQARNQLNLQHKARRLKTKFGITPADVDRLLAGQGGVCAICKGTNAIWHVDHDHSCCPGQTTCGGCIRGILCQPCNLALGLFKDNADSLRAAANYLERSDQYVR
jgi:hypothetical protein